MLAHDELSKWKMTLHNHKSCASESLKLHFKIAREKVGRGGVMARVVDPGEGDPDATLEKKPGSISDRYENLMRSRFFEKFTHNLLSKASLKIVHRSK